MHEAFILRFPLTVKKHPPGRLIMRPLGRDSNLSFRSPMLLNQLADHFVAGDLTMDPLPGQFLCVLGNRHTLDLVTGIRNALRSKPFLDFRHHCHPPFLLSAYHG